MTETIRLAVTGDDYRAVADLMTEYVAALPFELTFQDFGAELAALQTTYGGETGAAFLVEAEGAPVGVCAVSRFDGAIAELKRMYLRPEARGRGLGRLLAGHAIAATRRLGYQRVRLDTVDSLHEAIALYRSLGFVEIAVYRHNPQPDARFFELDLGDRPRPATVGVVLAGGASKRMGNSKPSLRLGELTMLEHVQTALVQAGLGVYTAGREQDAPGMAGPLAGLIGAMRRHPGSDVFLTAADQPYLVAVTVAQLLSRPGDIVAPHDSRPQTTCAVYRDSCVPHLERFAAHQPEGSLQDVLAERAGTSSLIEPHVWRTWGEDGRSWLSIDTPGDYERAVAAWPDAPPMRQG